MYVAIIISKDEPDEGPFVTLGPYESREVAQQDGDGFASFCNDEYPGHEWTVWVEEVLT